ncbi:MAG TPA: hypothetical protein VM577_03905 [Anaerovoracaceae bacterium]|nr:hypothetical protein [Anaerovoracaceae bacterium]
MIRKILSKILPSRIKYIINTMLLTKEDFSQLEMEFRDACAYGNLTNARRFAPYIEEETAKTALFTAALGNLVGDIHPEIVDFLLNETKHGPFLSSLQNSLLDQAIQRARFNACRYLLSRFTYETFYCEKVLLRFLPDSDDQRLKYLEEMMVSMNIAYSDELMEILRKYDYDDRYDAMKTYLSRKNLHEKLQDELPEKQNKPIRPAKKKKI